MMKLLAPGGGQPADQGTISACEGGGTFAVSMVSKDKAGVVSHDGPEEPSLKVSKCT